MRTIDLCGIGWQVCRDFDAGICKKFCRPEAHSGPLCTMSLPPSAVVPSPPCPRDECGLRSPSLSQSAVGSALPSMRTGAFAGLAAALGRQPNAAASSVAQDQADSVAAAALGVSAAPATVSSDTAASAAAVAPSSSQQQQQQQQQRLFELGTNFQQLGHGSLSIDASWTDLAVAMRTSLLAEETPQRRRQLQEQLADLFRKQTNVYDTQAQIDAANERAHLPPLSTQDVSYDATAASAASAGTPRVNRNSTLPIRFLAPSYLRSEHNIITCLSARSCLDQWLGVMAFPAGSRVLLTAVNIPDISVVLRAHKLVPVPIDLHADTLAPQLPLLEAAASKGTASERKEGTRVVAILVAQLYGRRFDMEPIVQIAQKYNIKVPSASAREHKRNCNAFAACVLTSFSVAFVSLSLSPSS